MTVSMPHTDHASQTSVAAGRGSAPAARGLGGSRGSGSGGRTPGSRQIVKTWAFDSVGPRKYALQIQKAANGNPLLLLVEGRKQDDGTYRKTSLFVWSEDFQRLFATLDEVRSYITEHGIRTPDGHTYQRGNRARSGGAGAGRKSGRGGLSRS